MDSRITAFVVLLVFGLAACSSPPPRRTRKTSDDAAGAAKATLTPQPAETARPVESVRLPEPSAKGAESAPKVTPGPPVADTGDFQAEQIAGKSIATWVDQLRVSDKDQLLEAIECCRIAGAKASRGIARMTELATNPDRDIAKAANEALLTMRGIRP